MPSKIACSFLISEEVLLTRKQRPQRTATNQMHMDVIYLLAAITITVNNQTITAFGDTFLLSNFCRNRHHTTQCSFMFNGHIIHGGDQNIRNDQNMAGSLRGNIPERSDQLILINHIGWDLTADNFAENRLFGHLGSPVSIKSGLRRKWLRNRQPSRETDPRRFSGIKKGGRSLMLVT